MFTTKSFTPGENFDCSESGGEEFHEFFDSFFTFPSHCTFLLLRNPIEEGRSGKKQRQRGSEEEAASLFTVLYSHLSRVLCLLLHLGPFPLLGPVISDNVNDLVESPPQRMICDM